MIYRPEIDGLRALAVIPVILFHAGFSGFAGGFIGVDIFFVISGYLISSIILDEIRAGKFSIVNFYERRARRILPALFFILAVTTLIGWFWLLPNEYRQFSQSLVGVVSFTSNIFFYLTGGYFGGMTDMKPLIHTWSLSVEEQFYLVFPLLMVALARHSNGAKTLWLVALTLASLVYAQWQSVRDPSFNYLMLPTRFWELSVGSLLALYLSQSDRPTVSIRSKNFASLLGSILVLVAIISFDEQVPYPSLYTTIPILGVSLLILFADPQTLVGRLLSLKPVVQIGLVSYSAYLWHQVLFALAKHRSISPLTSSEFLLLSTLTLVLAYVTWLLVEQPFRKRQRFGRAMIFGSSAALLLSFGVFGVVGHLNDGFPNRLPADVAKAHITKEHEQQLRKAGCPLLESQQLSQCQLGAHNQPARVALVGDSHAAALVSALQEKANAEHFAFVPFVKSACPLNFFESIDQQNIDKRQCALYQQAIRQQLLSDQISTVIVATRFDAVEPSPITGEKQTMMEQHRQSILQLLAAKKRVILVYPVPVYKTYISDYVAKNLWFYQGALEPISVESQVFTKRIQPFFSNYDAIPEQPNLQRIYPHHLLCDSIVPGRCVTELQHQPLYFDDDHLSIYGARLVLQALHLSAE